MGNGGRGPPCSSSEALSTLVSLRGRPLLRWPGRGGLAMGDNGGGPRATIFGGATFFLGRPLPLVPFSFRGRPRRFFGVAASAVELCNGRMVSASRPSCPEPSVPSPPSCSARVVIPSSSASSDDTSCDCDTRGAVGVPFCCCDIIDDGTGPGLSSCCPSPCDPDTSAAGGIDVPVARARAAASFSCSIV